MKNEIKRAMHKTPKHYSYHPESYSEQARELSNRAIDNVNCGAWCLEQAFRFFVLSYRCERIRFRALRRFMRYVNNGKIQEHPESVIAWKKFKEERELDKLEEMVGEYLEY